ncbi:hypothetical protein JSQ81_10105 [Sporosarcina sp. Marseille-Q4063]|uniref:SunI/YnzG family protein n=1 Tax=Sporosarcina sp. Marseille-Q4063 TaxID=2810514 RepID=UPI001BB06913|nr:hypothetical protein [Sporosarcina sp. Marseille-Q4063]QUW23808.1 hypothetical protein JSQ81_10105 [Sporosarcina sp. Marseille-Q4063]
MFELNVEELKDKIVIKWQLSKIAIPISEIVEVTDDDTYSGREKNAIRIGFPYGTDDRIVIKTTTETYILFTSSATIKKKIYSIVN